MEGQDDSSAGWDAICYSITGAFRSGEPMWPAVRGILGDGAGELGEGGAVSWQVPIGRIAPTARDSVIDYASVTEVGADAGGTHARIALGAPHRTREALGVKAGTRTHRVVETEFSVQEGIWHNVSQDALAEDGSNVARDMLASIRDEVLLDVERAVRSSLVRSDGPMLARTLRMDDKRRTRDVGESGALEGADVLRAARAIADANHGTRFPHGLFCVASPRQARLLFDSNDLWAGEMEVDGVSVVVSPAFGDATGTGWDSVLVAARGSVSVALSTLEVIIGNSGGECRIGARYAMGASIDPAMSAVIIT